MIKCFVPSEGFASLFHVGSKFSTKDQENGGQCIGGEHSGGWWYATCYASNLNGAYLKGSGVAMHDIKGAHFYMAFIEMKLKLAST